MSTSSSRCRSASPLKGLIKGVIKAIKKKRPFTEEEFGEIWEAVVGKRAASHTKPVSLRKSVLKVNVDESAWLYELTLEKKEILRKLEERIKDKKIKGIRFRIGEINSRKE